MEKPTRKCSLCGLPVEGGAIKGRNDEAYCCRGCHAVDQVLEDTEPTDPGDVEGETAYIDVGGMHCSACETYVEHRARKPYGVLEAEASYATDSLKVTYDKSETDVGEIEGAVEGMGYTVGKGSSGVGRLIVGGFFAFMVMMTYIVYLYPSYLGFEGLIDLSSQVGTYLLLNVWVMASVVVFYTGFPILRGAYVSLHSHRPNMDLLLSIAVLAAYIYSSVAVLTGFTEVYFDVSVAVVMAVTIGGYVEDRVKNRATRELSELTKERVNSAAIRTPKGTIEIPIEGVEAGDEVLVKEGDRVPLDGRVAEGSALVDESLLSGEPTPVRKSTGDEVVGGSVVADGSLVVEVGSEASSTFDRLREVVWDIQSSTPGAQRLADRIAAVFVPAVLLIAAIATAANYYVGGDGVSSLLVGLAVLVVSCPCALGLATPLALASGVREGLRRGVVFTDQSVFEAAPEVEVIGFDKTGTLTTGQLRVGKVHASNRSEVLKRAAAVEEFSSHPIAEAITRKMGGTMRAQDYRSLERGACAVVSGDRVVVGDRREFQGWDGDPALWDAFGDDTVGVGWDGRLKGVIELMDEPRRGWRETVEWFGDLEVVVVTGDDSAEDFRGAVDDVVTDIRPKEKARVLAGRGGVAMVGDGVNDAAALAASDLGIAVGDRAAVAGEAADVVVSDVTAVPSVFELVRETNGRVRQNLGWAFLYNAVAVPVAAVGLLNPLWAAAAMSLSSFVVVLNSARSFGVEGVGDYAEPERSDGAVKEDAEEYPGLKRNVDGASEEASKHYETESKREVEQ